MEPAINKRGKFIVFEGIDGSGKTTQLGLLTKTLAAANVPFIATKEPSDGPIGALLRRYLTRELSADANVIATLFAADRLEHIMREDDGMLMLLESGINVICDRYCLSSLAYQSVDIDIERILELNRTALDLLVPDMTIFMDITPEDAMERISRRGKIELYEQLESQKIIRENYYLAIKLTGMPITIIDGNKPKSQVADDILSVALSLL